MGKQEKVFVNNIEDTTIFDTVDNSQCVSMDDVLNVRKQYTSFDVGNVEWQTMNEKEPKSKVTFCDTVEDTDENDTKEETKDTNDNITKDEVELNRQMNMSVERTSTN